MRTGIVLLAGLFSGVLPGFSEGYLPLVGPAPLRFLAEPAPATVVTNRPPLPAPIPAPTAATLSFEEDEVLDWADLPAEGTNSAAIVARSPLFSFLPGGDTNAIGAFSTQPSNELITPQVLLHYFHQRFGETDDPAAGVVVPLMFIPPQLGPRSPSKAVFASP